jgi:hypothetical protein
MSSRIPEAHIFLTAFVCLVVLVSVGTGGTGSGKPDRPQISPQSGVKSSVEALTASLVETENTGVNRLHKIQVTNVSDKGIVAYAFLKKDGSTLTTDGATTGWVLAPNDSDAVTLTTGPSEELDVTLFASLSEDGTGQGDFREVSRMKDYRVGIARQFERAIPLLRAVRAGSGSAAADRAVTELRSKLVALPEETPGESVSPGMSSGIHHAKQFMLHQLRQPQGKIQAGTNEGLTPADVSRVLTKVEGALSKIRR